MTQEERKKYCGAGKSAFFIPDFIFSASCQKHDEYYAQGGGIVEKVMADTFFYAYMLEDISVNPYPFKKKMFYFTMATLYFLMVSTFGCLFYNWKIKK